MFETLIKEVTDNINTWTNERETIIENGKLLKKDEEAKLISNILNNEPFVTSFNETFKLIRNEELELLGTKKFKTIVSLLTSKNKSENI